MELKQLPIPDQPLTIDRVNAARRKRGVWKACDFCGHDNQVLVPEKNREECLSLFVTDFATDEQTSRTADLAVVCLSCGKSELFDYIILNRFVYAAETDS